MFIPNYGNVYGSIPIMTNANGIRSYVWSINIKKTRILAKDQPSQRCTDVTVANTSACIARHIEEQLGCTPRIHGSRIPSKSKACSLQTELQKLARISKQLEESDANEIYGITGCLSSCHRFKYQVEFSSLKSYKESETWNSQFLDVQLFIKTGLFEEREQYLIYDWDSFIADVGGFLGLLLGWSMYSLYQDMVDIVERVKKKILYRYSKY